MLRNVSSSSSLGDSRQWNAKCLFSALRLYSEMGNFHTLDINFNDSLFSKLFHLVDFLREDRSVSSHWYWQIVNKIRVQSKYCRKMKYMQIQKHKNIANKIYCCFPLAYILGRDVLWRWAYNMCACEKMFQKTLLARRNVERNGKKCFIPQSIKMANENLPVCVVVNISALSWAEPLPDRRR